MPSEIGIQDDRIAGLPPSAKLVYLVVRENGPCTTDEIASASMLPYRTASYALDRLSDEGIVSREPCMRDARRSRYRVTSVE